MKGFRKWGRWEGSSQSFDEGGQGYVYRVVDSTRELPGTFVLKELKNPKRQGRFETEIRAIAALGQHPNVVHLVDTGVCFGKDKPFYVMPEADGGSLERFLTDQPHDVERLLCLFEAIVRGVAHIHAAGIIHRDIKPENILMFNGVPKISDLGLALIAEMPRLTPTEEAVGPRFYMAPELEDGRNLDVIPSADIYSLGKVLYFMLSAGKVFAREKQDLSRWSLSRLHDDGRYELFRPIFHRTIAASHRDRYPSATGLLAAAGEAKVKFVQHPGTTLRAKVPGIEVQWTAPPSMLARLNSGEWKELLRLREKHDSEFSRDLLDACRDSLHPPLAGHAALEVLRHEREIDRSELVDWCVRIVKLESKGDPYLAISPIWERIYCIALESRDLTVANLIMRDVVFASPEVLAMMVNHFELLEPDAKASVLAGCASTEFEGREALLLRASRTDLTRVMLSFAVAGLVHIASEQCVDRVAELLRGAADEESLAAITQGIALNASAATMQRLRARAGYSDRVAGLIGVLTDSTVADTK